MIKFKISIKIDASNDYPFWIFSKAISRRVIKILAYNECALSRHQPRATEYLNSRFTYQPISVMSEVFKVALAQWLLFYQWI